MRESERKRETETDRDRDRDRDRDGDGDGEAEAEQYLSTGDRSVSLSMFLCLHRKMYTLLKLFFLILVSGNHKLSKTYYIVFPKVY